MFNPTTEQQNIFEDFNANNNIKIHAFAGTGKTSTLCFLAEQTNRKGIYLAFNTRIANEAKKLMPSNVQSATIHSFAANWAKTQFDYKKLFKNLTANTLNKDFTVPEVGYFSKFKTATLILRIVQNYCQNDTKKPTEKHIPWSHDAYISDGDQLTLKKNKDLIVSFANSVWNSMASKESEVALGHDGYLKLWVLSRPKLNAEFLFIDEAQDLNPVMQSVITKFKGQLVIVGDSQQQIYAWRGAEDTMQIKLNAKEHFLTQTFRFDSELANIANTILKHLNVSKKIVSANENGTKVVTKMLQMPNAFLFRKNAKLIAKATELYSEKQPFHLVDPNHNIKETVLDYFRLNDGIWGESQTFKGFKSWNDVINVSESERDHPFGKYIELFEENDPADIREAIESAKKRQKRDYPSLSSIHQAKGLEWNHVELDDDFNLDLKSQCFDEQQEELRLLYVGLTRARKTLCLSEELLEFCSHSKNHN